MTTYATGNPLGSQDPRDLLDNAENLDRAANSLEDEDWVDRKGVVRKTWHGIEKKSELDIAHAISGATAEAKAYRDGALEARDDAVAAAGAIGPLKFYATYSAVLADSENIPPDSLVEIARDETKNNARTRYFKRAGGALEFSVNLDQLRLDLEGEYGASHVGYRDSSYQGDVGGALQDVRLTAQELIGPSGFKIAKNIAGSYGERSDFVGDVNNGVLDAAVDGSVVVADGYIYIKDVGSEDIPDIKGWRPPIANSTFYHYGNRRDSLISSPRASISHIRSSGLIYDLVTISNPQPGTLRKVFSNNPDIGCRVAKEKIQAWNRRENNRYAAIFNADGFRGASIEDPVIDPIVIPIGLQIADGIVYQEWLPSEDRKRGIAMTKSGLLIETSRDDGLTGEQYVKDKGVVWTVGWGDICVRNGQSVNMSGSYTGTVKSARTILGQKSNGDILIFSVEGLTGSYGASPQECANLAASHGCSIAYICDGGGTTQAWWNGAYALHSSDAYSSDPARVGERAVGSMLVVDVPSVDVYDTGWIKVTEASGIIPHSADMPAVAVRQRGSEITLSLNVSGAFAKDSISLVAANTFPNRFRPNDVAFAKGVIVGDSGYLVGVFMGAGISISPQTHSILYAIGQVRWPTRFSGLPFMNL